MTTPNMLLPNPSPGVTISPIWAQDITDSLDLIDSHDHSTGQGVRITPAGLNINADLTFNSNDATDLRTARFSNQGSTPVGVDDKRIIYVKGNELCYRDFAGNEVQLTLNGTINVSAGVGVISGLVSPASASYSSITSAFSWLKDTNKPAKMLVSDLVIHEFDDATALPVTLKTNNVVSAYDIILPTTLPGVGDPAGVLTIDDAGNSSFTNTVPFFRQETRSKEQNNGVLAGATKNFVYSAPITQTFTNTSPSVTAGDIKINVPGNARCVIIHLSTYPDASLSMFATSSITNDLLFEVQWNYNGGAYTTFSLMQCKMYNGGGANETLPDRMVTFTPTSGSGDYGFRLRPYIGAAGSIAVNNMSLSAMVL